LNVSNAAISSNRSNASSVPIPHHVKCDVSVVNAAQVAERDLMSNVLSHNGKR
jgi:hypothetical protein